MDKPAKSTWLIPGLGLIACLGPFTNDAFVPSLSLIAAGLDADPGTVQITTSAVLLGFTAGALIYGPLSDRYGRKSVLCIALVCHGFSGMFGAIASSFEAVVAARALQGLCVSATMVLTRAIVLDRWSGAQASKFISWIGVFVFVMPVLAPLFGGYIAGFGYWPAIFWVQGAVGMIAAALTMLSLSRSPAERGKSIVAGIRSYGVVFNSAEAIGYMICTGLAFAGLISFISTSSIVFVDYYGLTPAVQAFCVSTIMLAAALSSFLNGRFVISRGIAAMIGFGTICLAAGGLLVLLACAAAVNPALLVVAIAIYIFGVGFLFSNSVAQAMSQLRGSVGAVSSAFAASQYVLGIGATAALSTVSTPGLMPLGITLALAGMTTAALWWGWLRQSDFTRRASGSVA